MAHSFALGHGYVVLLGGIGCDGGVPDQGTSAFEAALSLVGQIGVVNDDILELGGVGASWEVGRRPKRTASESNDRSELGILKGLSDELCADET